MPYSSSTFAGLEIALGDGAHLDHRPAQRWRQLVAEEDDARDRERRLEVHQMVRGPEGVEGPSPIL